MRQLDTPIIGKSYVVLLLNVSWKNRKARFASRTVTWKDGTKLRFSGDLYLRGAKHAHSGDPAFEGAFEQARTLAAQQGTKVVVLLFPTKEEVYLPLLNQPVPRPPRHSPRSSPAGESTTSTSPGPSPRGPGPAGASTSSWTRIPT